ncbi:MAG: universal stress protein [Thalassospira sp.]|nr:universal stress protein [Thalassospira sp.]
MYKTIFLPVSSNGDQSPALAFTAALTRSFAAKAEGTFVSKSLVLLQEDERTKVANVFRKEGFGASQVLTDTLYKEQFKKRAAEVKEWFVKTSSALGGGNSIIWQDTLDVFGESAEQIRNKCSGHDMTVASADISVSIRDTLLEGVLFATGRPLALIRSFTAGKTLEDATIILAWKQSPQTLRAQWFALPLLQKAKRVVVTHVQEGDEAEDIQGVLRYLEQHGIQAEAKLLATVQDAPLMLAQAYTEVKADLLVMGAYSHSRLREMLFGGFTRYFITDSQCNLLLAH